MSRETVPLTFPKRLAPAADLAAVESALAKRAMSGVMDKASCCEKLVNTTREPGSPVSLLSRAYWLAPRRCVVSCVDFRARV